jgi:predicted nucleic acid-binding protein
MVYVDTSALVPAFIREPTTDAVIGWIESAEERLALSDWTLVEFASAVAMKVRIGAVKASLAARANARVREFGRTHCTVVTPAREDFELAFEWVADDASGLRAGDALHLAVAARLRVRAILCFDDVMIRSAAERGLKAVHL